VIWRPRYDPVIHLGHILTAVSFIVFGIGAWYGIKSDVNVIQFRVSNMEDSLKTLATTMNTLANKAIVDTAQNEKLLAFEKRIQSNEMKVDRLQQRLETIR
jgi:predicted transcriptional regulator